MKQNKINPNNNLHLYGYINDVRYAETQKGTPLYFMTVATVGYNNSRDLHDVKITEVTPEMKEKLEALRQEFAEAKEKGVKADAHAVSLDGFLINRERPLGDTDKTYQPLQVIASASALDIDAKRGEWPVLDEKNEPKLDKEGKAVMEKERLNHATLAVNVISIDVKDDFAKLRVAQNYRAKDSDKEDHTFMNVTVSAKDIYTKKLFESIKNGEIGVGDFIRLEGQKKDNTYTATIDGKEVKKYDHNIRASKIAVISKKQAVTQTEEAAQKKEAKPAQAAAKAAKPAPKKATPKKKAAGPKL